MINAIFIPCPVPHIEIVAQDGWNLIITRWPGQTVCARIERARSSETLVPLGDPVNWREV